MDLNDIQSRQILNSKKRKSRSRKTTNKITVPLNKNKVIYKTPMGSSGPIIGAFPVILSEFDVNIFCELKYKYPIISMKSDVSTVILKLCKFSSDNKKMYLEGYIDKGIQISLADSTEDQKTTVKLPFKTMINIKYNKEPNFDTDYKSLDKDNNSLTYYFSPADKVYWSHEYTKITEKYEELPSESNDKQEFVNKIVLTLGMVILQDQRVFIPESTDDATVIAEFNNSNSENITHIDVGYDSKQGLIARIIKD